MGKPKALPELSNEAIENKGRATLDEYLNIRDMKVRKANRRVCYMICSCVLSSQSSLNSLSDIPFIIASKS